MKAFSKLMPNTKRASIFLALLASSFLLLGWAYDLDGIKKKVESVSSIQAKFTQEKHLEILDAPLVSKGLLYFQAPYSLRWEYTQPVRSVLLMENENIRQYTQAGNDMVEQKSRDLLAMRIFLREICMWIKGDFKANPDLEAVMDTGRKVLLKPVKDKAMAQVIQRIELSLTDIPGVIESIRIYENPVTYTDIRFHDTKINKRIERDVFQKLHPDAIKQ
jgi:outer membrane lipoprotein-sorting protein